MAFDIVKYLENNKIEMGTVKKEVGDTVFKGGHNDLRKTQYDVTITDGKLDLHTHNTVLSESKSKINEASGTNSVYICTFATERGQFVYTPKVLMKWLEQSNVAAATIRRILGGPLGKTMSNGKDFSDENSDHLESVTRVRFEG